MITRDGQAGASRSLSGCTDWARPEGIRWWRAVGQLGFLLAAIAVSATFVTLPDLDRPPTEIKPVDRNDRGKWIEAVAFSSDGRTVLSCGADGQVEFWSTDELMGGQSVVPRVILEGQPRLAASYSPDGRDFAVAGVASASIWRLEAGGFREMHRLYGSTYRCLAFSPDGSCLALGDDDGAIRLFNVESGIETRCLEVHVDAVRSLAFSPDGRRLVSTGQDRRVMLWDLEKGQAIRNLTDAGDCPVQYAAFSPDGRTLAVGEAAGSPQDVLIMDSHTGEVKGRLSGHEAGIRTLAFSPDGLTLATAGLDRKVILWDLKTYRIRRGLGESVGLIESLAFSPDGTRLAFGGEDQRLSIWDFNRPRLVSIDRRTHARALHRLTRRHTDAETRLPGA